MPHLNGYRALGNRSATSFPLPSARCDARYCGGASRLEHRVKERLLSAAKFFIV